MICAICRVSPKAVRAWRAEPHWKTLPNSLEVVCCMGHRHDHGAVVRTDALAQWWQPWRLTAELRDGHVYSTWNTRGAAR